MPGAAKQKDSLELPPRDLRPSRRDSADEVPTSTNSSQRPSVSSSGGTEQSSVGSAVSHFSVSTLLGLRGVAPTSSATDKAKGEKARSLLRMLLRTQKTCEDSSSYISTDVHNLIPCGDVAGLLAVSVKQCKDFTPKFSVKHDTYLLIRISIDKIMKCTNPQVYRANIKNNKKNPAIYFGDVRYFSVKVPKQKSDPRNKIALELVGFEGPKDFPRLFGTVTMHLYEVIQKQSFIEICAMRIRNMVFCTAEVEFMFCYGSLGYGYSHQLKLPGTDPAKAVAYSMFLRVPPPENRKDHTSNVIKPLRMDYPSFLSPDLNVTVGSLELDNPTEGSEHYRSLQRALKKPPQERLERMKNEYRNLTTWRDKADYLDQLILKRGPKTKAGQTKVSRFREIVGRIQHPIAQQSSIYSSSETVIKEEQRSAEVQKWPSTPSTPSSPHMYLEVPVPVPSREDSDSDRESVKMKKPVQFTEKIHIVPALSITSSTSCSGSSDSGENLKGKFIRERLRRASETSVSSGITAEFSETGDSESFLLSGTKSKVIPKEPPDIEKKESALEYLPEPPVQEPHSRTDVSVKVSDSVVEPVEQWPWKVVEFKEPVFNGNKFEPFLRHICKIQPPPFCTGKGDDFSHLEKKYSFTDLKEQEDQDPPHGLSLTKADSHSDINSIKSGEQLSILRLIEKKMDLEEEDQKPAMKNENEPNQLSIPFGFSQKPSGDKQSKAETEQVDIYSRKSLEAVLVDKLVKVVALRSLLSNNIENLVAEKLSEAGMSQEFENSNSSSDREKHLYKERKPSSGENISEPNIKNLKDVVSQNLQACLIGKLSEQGLIPELAEKDQKVSLPSASDLFKRRRSVFKERTSQTEIVTLKSLSGSQLGNISKTESMPHSKESSIENLPVVTETSLSESKIDYDRELNLPVKSQDGSVEGAKAKIGLTIEHSKQSLEIIRVTLPLSTETGNVKQQLSIHDMLIERILKAEITSLKTFLSKGLQDHLKDKLSEIGLHAEDLETVCRKLSLNMKGKHAMTREKDILQESQVSSKESLAEETPVLSESVQNIFEALSESEIANLKSLLNKKIHNHLSERLSEIGLITEKELRKILENVFPVVKETPPKGVKGSEGQSVYPTSSSAQSLQDRFSEEELQNLKSLLSRLLKDGHKDKLSDSEVKGLTSVLQKSSVNLPMQNSLDMGISKEVEIKDKCHSLSLSNGEESSKVSNIVISDKEKGHSKESIHNISTVGDKYCIRGENPDHSVNNIFEVETKNQETQTMLLTKKVKHIYKKECHRLPGYPENPELANLRRGSFEAGLKSKPADEPLKRIVEPFASSSFLSAHDIGVQTEIKNYLSKPPNYLSKPSFPVNPQTFRFLHSESEEEAKPASKHHQKLKNKKKPDKKKDAVLHHPQQTVTNTQIKKERTNNGNLSKEFLKCKKHGEPPPPKLSMTENRKDSKAVASPTSVRKENLRQKAEKKHDNEVKPKKSLSKTAALSDLQLQNLPKNLQEKSSTTKIPPFGRTKGNTLTLAGTEDLDVEAFKHLEKAIERALIDLGGISESGSSHGRASTVPGAAAVFSRDSSRAIPSAVETPKNQAGSISEMLNNQEQVLKMTPEQLTMVLRILQSILKQNTAPK